MEFTKDVRIEEKSEKTSVYIYKPVLQDSFQEQARNPKFQQRHHGPMQQDLQEPIRSSSTKTSKEYCDFSPNDCSVY